MTLSLQGHSIYLTSYLCVKFRLPISEFEESLELEFRSFAQGLRLEGSLFRKSANLCAVNVNGDLILRDASFAEGILLDDICVTQILRRVECHLC